jgi:putative oxidoreductase
VRKLGLVSLVRRLAGPLLAGIFISGGLDVLQRPEPRAKLAEPVVRQVAAIVPGSPSDPQDAVRLNALTHVIAGSALALGILPRISALVLAGSIVPTTFGGHRFWELEDAGARAQQRTHFLKNAAIFGGLLVTALG